MTDSDKKPEEKKPEETKPEETKPEETKPDEAKPEELINKIKSYESDLKSFREEKNKIRNELISHYHNILHEGKDIRKDGLSWVIQAIWNLKSEVLPSYLPKFLDEESISFLFNYSSQKIQLKEMYKTVQKINKKIM